MYFRQKVKLRCTVRVRMAWKAMTLSLFTPDPHRNRRNKVAQSRWTKVVAR